MANPKIGRNDPCSCGSGKKYKQCCMQREAGRSLPAAGTAAIDLAQLMQTAAQYYQAGSADLAEMLCQQVLRVKPRHADALHLSGLLATNRGESERAVELIGKAIKEHPSAEMYCNLGVALKAQGKLDAAIDSYRRAIALDPKYGEAHSNLGLALKAQGKLDAAIESLRKAIALNPDYVGIHKNLDNALIEQRRHELVDRCKQAIALDPASANAHNNLGVALHAQGELEAAIDSYREAIALEPTFALAHCNLGNVLKEQGDLEQAITSYEKAIALDSNLALAHCNLGNAFREQGRLDQALAEFSKAILINPEMAEAHSSLGVALVELGRLEESLECYRRALALKPDFTDARFNYGVLLLMMGKLDEGWREYDYRFTRKAEPSRRYEFPQPWWQGESLRERTVLVWGGEQGIGDELTFASMYADLIAMAKRCVIACSRKLVPLLARSFPGAEVVPLDALGHPSIARADVQCAAGSLGRWLRPSVESFPRLESFLTPAAERVSYWKGRLNALGPGLKVGICWRSKNLSGDRYLYCTRLDQWGPILWVPGVHFVNVQYDECSAELEAARKRFGVPIHAFEEVDLYDDLDEAAALTRALDLVISAPTAASVLAAVVGVPTWQLLYGPDWHWFGTGRNLWFGSMETIGRRWDQSWETIIEEVAARLRGLA